jgi:hypothetical protein
MRRLSLSLLLALLMFLLFISSPDQGNSNLRLSNSCAGSVMTRFPSHGCPRILVDLYIPTRATVEFVVENAEGPFAHWFILLQGSGHGYVVTAEGTMHFNPGPQPDLGLPVRHGSRPTPASAHFAILSVRLGVFPTAHTQLPSR